MAEAALKKQYTDISSTSNNVIDFNQYRSQFASSINQPTQSPAFDFEDPEYDKKLKAFIESSIYNILMKENLLNRKEMDNPFGSVYLCDLLPDKIEIDAIKTIKKLSSKIEDRSEELSFNDGMDD